MKKILIIFILSLTFTGILSADQLAYLSKDQAEKAAAFLKAEKEVLLFCGCCSDDPKVYLKVTGVKIQYTGYQEYWEIIITGIKRTGEPVLLPVDLAYVHVKRGSKAICAGTILDFECDPCVTDLDWDSAGK